MSYQAQHRAAAAAPQDHQPYQPYKPYVVPGAVPPVRPRKTRNHLVLRIVVLAFIAQWPLWLLAITVGPPVGSAALVAAICADAVLTLGAIYGVCYGVYRLTRWALGL